MPYNGGFVITYHLMDIHSERNPKNAASKLVLGYSNSNSGDFSIYPVKPEDRSKIENLFSKDQSEKLSVKFFECK